MKKILLVLLLVGINNTYSYSQEESDGASNTLGSDTFKVETKSFSPGTSTAGDSATPVTTEEIKRAELKKKYKEKYSKKLGEKLSKFPETTKKKLLIQINKYLNKKGLSNTLVGKLGALKEIIEESITVIYKVEEVVDGDTVKISSLGKEYSVRLIGIDSPESYATRFGYKECYGDEAKEYLRELIEGENVTIELDPTQGETDKYGRLLGYIIHNGNNINKSLIEAGYAWEYTYDKPYKYQELFKESENIAKENKYGLWDENTCNGERLKETTSTDNIIDKEAEEVIEYHSGPRGGCYYLTDNGNKEYVDRSYCSND